MWVGTGKGDCFPLRLIELITVSEGHKGEESLYNVQSSWLNSHCLGDPSTFFLHFLLLHYKANDNKIEEKKWNAAMWLCAKTQPPSKF